MYQEYILEETWKSFYLCKMIACHIFPITLPDSHLHTNKNLINLLYNDVKNLSSILNCYIGPKCVASNNYAKPLSLYVFTYFYNST